MSGATLLSRKALARVAGVQVVLLAAGYFLAPIAGPHLPALAVGLTVVISTVYLSRALSREVAKDLKVIRRDASQVLHLPALLALLPLRRPLPPTGGFAASADFALLLAQLVREKRPRQVLELGSGVSTLVVGYALEAFGAGRMLSLEHGAPYAAEAADRVRAHGLSDRVEVTLAALEPYEIEGRTFDWYARGPWTALPDGSVDMLIVDGPPQRLQSDSRFPALPLLAAKLRQGAVIVLDDCSDERTRGVLRKWQEMYRGLAVQTHSYLESQPAVLSWQSGRAP